MIVTPDPREADPVRCCLGGQQPVKERNAERAPGDADCCEPSGRCGDFLGLGTDGSFCFP